MAPVTPQPKVVTTYGEWQGGSPTCDDPTVTQTRAVTTTTTTYAWKWNTKRSKWVKVAHKGQPVITTDTQTLTYQGDSCVTPPPTPPTNPPTPPVTPPTQPAPPAFPPTPNVCAPGYFLPDIAGFTWSLNKGDVIATRLADGATKDYGVAPIGQCQVITVPPAEIIPPAHSTTTPKTPTVKTATSQRTPEAPQTDGIGNTGESVWLFGGVGAAGVVGLLCLVTWLFAGESLRREEVKESE